MRDLLEETCLFLVEGGPIAVDAPGGAAPVVRSRLELLCGSLEAVVVAVLDPGDWWRSPDLPSPVSAIEPVARRRAPEAALERLVARHAAGWIWAEHYAPAALGATIGLPYLYGHHDWLSKIKPLRYPDRYSGLAGWIRRSRLRRAERRVVRRARACVTSSITERSEIDRAGGHGLYLPLTYPDLAEAPNGDRGGDDRDRPPDDVLLVHLGGMQTTANVRGLESFVERLAERGSDNLPPLRIIGSLEGAPERLLSELRHHGADLVGFVERLDTVLRPFDLHIVPWRHDSGTRTKIPLALRSRQVVVSTRKAAAAFPELESGVDCVLVESIDEMLDRIETLARDPEERLRIGTAARSTFLSRFTQPAVQPRFDRMLAEVLSRS